MLPTAACLLGGVGSALTCGEPWVDNRLYELGQLATVLLGVEHLELSGRFVLVDSLIDHRGQANLLDVLYFLTQTSWPFLVF